MVLTFGESWTGPVTLPAGRETGERGKWRERGEGRERKRARERKEDRNGDGGNKGERETERKRGEGDEGYRWNRNPRLQPHKFRKLVFLI